MDKYEYDRQQRVLQHKSNYSNSGRAADDTLNSSLLHGTEKRGYTDPALRSAQLSGSSSRLDQSFARSLNSQLPPRDPISQPPRRKVDRCAQCVKQFLFILNCIYLALGFGLLVVGVFLVVDRSFLAPVIDQMLLIATPSLMMIGGLFIFLITFVGCCGATHEKKGLLILYFVIMVVSILILTVVAVLGGVILFQIWDATYVREAMRRNLQMYYGIHQENWYNRILTEGWDAAQSRLKCCSVDEQSWDIYRGSNWFKELPGEPRFSPDFVGPPHPLYKTYVPESCCIKNTRGQYVDLVLCQTNPIGPPSMQTGFINTALHYKGCYHAAVDFLYVHAPVFIGLGCCVALLLILGPIFAVCLYIRI